MLNTYAAIVNETDLGERVFFVVEDAQETAREALKTMFPDLAGCRATIYRMPIGFAEALGLEQGQAAEWPVGAVVRF
jgi:hypothetical protein